MLPDSYTAVHRYDGAMLQRGQRETIVECQLTARDVSLIRDVWRYRFLTTEQLRALAFAGRTPQAARRRFGKLFGAGYLERFRPYCRRGSYPWTYHLGPAGHKLLQQARHIEPRARYQPRALVDYSYVIHDLQLNAWILAYRELLGETLVEWHGETPIQPPPKSQRAQLALATPWTAAGLKDTLARPVFPDAVLEIKRPDGPPPWTFLLEHDRTRRVDKNFDKFRRYDAFLVAWHHQSSFARPGGDEPAPYVLFICQDGEQRDLFMRAADHELTGHRWHPAANADQHEYLGRQRTLFATELDMHTGIPQAHRLPPHPPGHPARSRESSAARRVRLPDPRGTAPRPTEPRPKQKGAEVTDATQRERTAEPA